VSPGIPVRNESGDGVVEMSQPIEMVLGASREDDAELRSDLGGGSDELGSARQVRDSLGRGVVVLD
jgi:hypothetical protein